MDRGGEGAAMSDPLAREHARRLARESADRPDPLDFERSAAAGGLRAFCRSAVDGLTIGLLIGMGLLLILTLSGCAYLDAAHAVKEEGKAYTARLNDHYADDVGDLARTIPAGALARMPVRTRCALADLAGLTLIECQFVAMPGWAANGDH
jgi:hypothetical protein